ncbi:hypothetical protein GCM10027091_67310 [Streptomyces daliensis]
MSEPVARAAARCHHANTYCVNCDLLVGLDDLHVIDVDPGDGDRLTVRVESARMVMGCRTCGAIAHSHGRREVVLTDAPCFDRPVKIVWRKRTWRCVEPACPVGTFTEQNHTVAEPRALLTVRAYWWAIRQLRREHASVRGIARQLGTTWNTVWTSIRPLLKAMADDDTRFDGVTRLGVDEHVRHHVSERPIDQGGRGPKMLGGMVNLTTDAKGRTRARLCAQQLRAAYQADSPAEGRKIAEKVLATFPTCPIKEIKRLGKTLRQWREAFLAYFDTGRANNGGTEAINGLIELQRRIARGFRNRDHYRLRMLLIGGGLTSPHLK